MAKSRPPRRVSLHPFLTLLLIPALVSAAVSASDPLAAVAESPSLPRELRARLRASSVELASAGLAPLVDAAVDARGGAEAIARRLRETRHAVEALCGSALELEDPVEDPHLLATAPPADVPPDPTPVVDTPANFEDTVATAGNLAALFSWLADELEAHLAVAPTFPSSPPSDDVHAGGKKLEFKGTYRTRALADELQESRSVLARWSSGPDDSPPDDSRSGFSCYRWSGYIARSLAARNALALPFDELVEATAAWSKAELNACGLRDFADAFDKAGGTNEDDDDASPIDTLNLTAFGKVVETCRMKGGNGLDELVGPNGRVLAVARLRSIKSHLSALAKSLGTHPRGCLANNKLEPRMDDETDAPPNARLATATALLSFLAGAAEDVLTTSRGCERAGESARMGAFYPIPAFDRIAQELSQCGLGDTYGREWLWANYPGQGTAGLAAKLDEVRAAAGACEVSTAAKATGSKETSLVRVDLDALTATIDHFRSADAAMFGCRRGNTGDSAAGRLADALDAYRTALASCPSASATKTFTRVSITGSPPGSVVTPYVVLPAREFEPDGRGRRGTFDPDGAGFVGVISAACVLTFGVFCFGAFYLFKRRSDVRGPWRKMGTNGGLGGTHTGRPPRVPSSSSGASPRGTPAPGFSARRFYRHLQAGSAGDLPLVEDLDRHSGFSSESEGGDRFLDTPGGIGAVSGNVVDVPSPRHNRRSNSISMPATRPPPSGSDDVVIRGSNGNYISNPLPRHPSRHSTPYHGLRSVGELRVNIPTGSLPETADGRRPTTPPAGASGAAPFFEDTRLTHP